jgi:hypothetical protein
MLHDAPCSRAEEPSMTICPIAIAVGCKKCPAFSVCPLKSVIGDQKKPEDKPAATNNKPR